MNFVFDVDGTLTPSRDKIDPYFEQFFLSFCSKNPVYLVTGSDYAKTVEQVGEKICHAVEGVYNCSGNNLNIKGQPIYSYDLELTDSEKVALETELRISGFPVRTGNHIENRIGTVNFSIVGRNASKTERQQYVEWDNATDERNFICKKLNNLFNRLECVIGGETGIDIFVKGRDKSQIVPDVRPFVFFGDKCEPGGNDYAIAKLADTMYNVKNWEETEYILRINYGKV